MSDTQSRNNRSLKFCMHVCYQSLFKYNLSVFRFIAHSLIHLSFSHLFLVSFLDKIDTFLALRKIFDTSTLFQLLFLLTLSTLCRGASRGEKTVLRAHLHN